MKPHTRSLYYAGNNPMILLRMTAWHAAETRVFTLGLGLVAVVAVAIQWAFSNAFWEQAVQEGWPVSFNGTRPYLPEDGALRTPTPLADGLWWWTFVHLGLGTVGSGMLMTSMIFLLGSNCRCMRWQTAAQVVFVGAVPTLGMFLFFQSLLATAPEGEVPALYNTYLACAFFIQFLPTLVTPVLFSPVLEGFLRRKVCFSFWSVMVNVAQGYVATTVFISVFVTGNTLDRVVLRIIAFPLLIEASAGVIRLVSRLWFTSAFPLARSSLGLLSALLTNAVLGRFVATNMDTFGETVAVALLLSGVELVMRSTMMWRDAAYAAVCGRLCGGQGALAKDLRAQQHTWMQQLQMEGRLEEAAILMSLPFSLLFRLRVPGTTTAVSPGDVILRVLVQYILEAATEMAFPLLYVALVRCGGVRYSAVSRGEVEEALAAEGQGVAATPSASADSPIRRKGSGKGGALAPAPPALLVDDSGAAGVAAPSPAEPPGPGPGPASLSSAGTGSSVGSPGSGVALLPGPPSRLTVAATAGGGGDGEPKGALGGLASPAWRRTAEATAADAVRHACELRLLPPALDSASWRAAEAAAGRRPELAFWGGAGHEGGAWACCVAAENPLAVHARAQLRRELRQEVAWEREVTWHPVPTTQVLTLAADSGLQLQGEGGEETQAGDLGGGVDRGGELQGVAAGSGGDSALPLAAAAAVAGLQGDEEAPPPVPVPGPLRAGTPAPPTPSPGPLAVANGSGSGSEGEGTRPAPIALPAPPGGPGPGGVDGAAWGSDSPTGSGGKTATTGTWAQRVAVGTEVFVLQQLRGRETRPWFMDLLLLLGFFASVQFVLRTIVMANMCPFGDPQAPAATWNWDFCVTA